MNVDIDMVPERGNKKDDVGFAGSVHNTGYLVPFIHWNGVYSLVKDESLILRPGLRLCISTLKNLENPIRFSVERSPLEFCFNLSGTTRYDVKHGNGRKDECIAYAGSSVLNYYPKTNGSFEKCDDQTVISVSVDIDPKLLNRFIETIAGEIPQSLRRIIDGYDSSYFSSIKRMTLPMRDTALQVLECNQTSGARQIFLEGKALELIALQLENLELEERGSSFFSSLSNMDLKKVYHAHDLLVHDLQTPPSLFELAKAVGMTHTRLNRGFREIYGTTVFGYLRKYRLEYADLLLKDSARNITEIAYAAGFSDSSHFSKAYLNHFGNPPSIYRKSN